VRNSVNNRKTICILCHQCELGFQAALTFRHSFFMQSRQYLQKYSHTVTYAKLSNERFVVSLPCSTGIYLLQNQKKHNHFTALWILPRTTRVSRYQKKHSPTHTYRRHQSSTTDTTWPSYSLLQFPANQNLHSFSWI